MGERDPAAAVHDEISPQREEALIEAMLRYQVSLDPDHPGPVLDVAAVGIVNSGWRNSPVEDWHAGDGPLSDGDMLRVNAHTTWRVRDIMRRWRTELGVTAQSPITVLDRLDANDVGWLAVRIFRWLVNPSRPLPTGVALADLAGNDLGEFTEHVGGTLGGFAVTAERRGARFALYRAAAHGGLSALVGHTDLAGTRPYLRPTFWTTPVTRTGDPAGVGGVGFRLSRTRLPTVLTFSESSSTGHGILSRVPLSGSSTRASVTCERRYPRTPTTWSFLRSEYVASSPRAADPSREAPITPELRTPRPQVASVVPVQQRFPLQCYSRRGHHKQLRHAGARTYRGCDACPFATATP